LIPELGVIEGYFGKPWSWRERAETISWLAPHGYGFFLYAPKADAYLRRNWQSLHPDEEMRELSRFAAHCRSLGVRFGIGINTFELHLAPGRGWQDMLARKLAHLDQLRPDDLAILFDDMRGDIPELAERQAAIVNFACQRTRASRVMCCPTYYSDDPVLDLVFGARPPIYLHQLGRMLDPAVEIMWTGPEVVAREFTPGHLLRIAEEIGRPPLIWDNYPVNDGARMSQHLHVRAFTGRHPDIAHHISAHGINPASQPVLSRIPMLTLVDTYRQGDRYDYAAAFERAAIEVLGLTLGERMRGDLTWFQDRGRDRLGHRHKALRDIYRSFPHPAAREVIAWLDGEWAVAEDLVQTQ